MPDVPVKPRFVNAAMPLTGVTDEVPINEPASALVTGAIDAVTGVEAAHDSGPVPVDGHSARVLVHTSAGTVAARHVVDTRPVSTRATLFQCFVGAEVDHGGALHAGPDALDPTTAGLMSRMRSDGRLANVKASQLSAGQRRRTALASLTVRRAEVWLLDEPHAGLDAAGRDELDALLRAAVQAGATVVLASHESERANGLASRVITIDGGGAR